MQASENLTQLEGVDLQDSWVLSWHLDAGRLYFEIEASLWPGHPQYEAPSQEEYTCYKRCYLVFPRASGVSGLRTMEEVRPVQDPDGTRDYGSIDSLIRAAPGKYQIFGEFGEVSLESDAPRFEFLDPLKGGA